MNKDTERKIKLETLNELQSVLGKHAVGSIFPAKEEVAAPQASADTCTGCEEGCEECTGADDDVTRLRTLLSKGE